MIDSPWIVKYYDMFQNQDTVNIVLEYIEGGSLRSIISDFGNFTESLAKNFTSQVLYIPFISFVNIKIFTFDFFKRYY